MKETRRILLERGPADTLLLDCWFPELTKHISVVRRHPVCGCLCYGGPRKKAQGFLLLHDEWH
jgi:hypothetical protein